MRVVVDTNIWVSALLNPSGPAARVLDLYIQGRFGLVTSEPLLEEIRDVLSRPRLTRKYKIRSQDILEFVMLLRVQAEIVNIAGKLKICRDPDDDKVLETAVAGKAMLIVSRDEDITRDPTVLEFLAELGIQVMTIKHFLSSLETID